MRIYRLHVTFIDKDGKKYTYEVSEGDNLLDIAQENDLEMEGMLREFWSNSCRLVLRNGVKPLGISSVDLFWRWKTSAWPITEDSELTV